MRSTDLKGWTDIGSDINWQDYGGRWAKRLRPGAYLVLRFENMEECCGADHNPDELYIAEVLCVDLREVTESGALTSALRSCGVKLDARPIGEDDEIRLVQEHSGDVAVALDPTNPEPFELCLVDACVGYGAYAPLHTESGPNQPINVRGRARAFAEELIREEPANVKSPILPSRVDALMERPVNKIGSTGREYMRGDIYSAMRRGAGNPAVDLVRKMYAACETTLDGTPIPSDIRSGS